MKKDIPRYNWPTAWYEEGKVFRAVMERAAKDVQAGKRPDEVLKGVHNSLADLGERIGSANVEGATNIAFAYLGFLYAQGIVQLDEGQYR